MKSLEKHIFICERCSYEEKGECQEGQGALLRKKLKQLALERWPKNRVRINASGCLGQCEQGISCVIYPSGDWHLNLRPGDETRLLSSLEKSLKN